MLLFIFYSEMKTSLLYQTLQTNTQIHTHWCLQITMFHISVAICQPQQLHRGNTWYYIYSDMPARELTNMLCCYLIRKAANPYVVNKATSTERNNADISVKHTSTISLTSLFNNIKLCAYAHTHTHKHIYTHNFEMQLLTANAEAETTEFITQGIWALQLSWSSCPSSPSFPPLLPWWHPLHHLHHSLYFVHPG